MYIVDVVVEDPCVPNPCQHGSNCTSEGRYNYSCACVVGVTGQNCEISKYQLNTQHKTTENVLLWEKCIYQEFFQKISQETEVVAKYY